MSYVNCTQAYQDGVANIPRTSPSYAAHLDRDNDGFGCDKPPSWFVARPSSNKPDATKPDATTQQHAVTSTTNKLPVTGPGEYGAAGGLLLVVGAVTLLALRRKRRVFSA